jgi:N-acetylglucosamine-6-phosphate deacetylase
MIAPKPQAKPVSIAEVTAPAGATLRIRIKPGVVAATIAAGIRTHETGIKIAGTESLEGAALPLKDDIGNCVSSGVCTLADAVRMTTKYPGRLAGNRGVLRPGAKADLVRFTLHPEEKRMKIHSVLIEGVEVE